MYALAHHTEAFGSSKTAGYIYTFFWRMRYALQLINNNRTSTTKWKFYRRIILDRHESKWRETDPGRQISSAFGSTHAIASHFILFCHVTGDIIKRRTKFVAKSQIRTKDAGMWDCRDLAFILFLNKAIRSFKTLRLYLTGTVTFACGVKV